MYMVIVYVVFVYAYSRNYMHACQLLDDVYVLSEEGTKYNWWVQRWDKNVLLEEETGCNQWV